MVETDKNRSESTNLPGTQESEARNALEPLSAPINADRLRLKIETWNEQCMQEGWSIQVPCNITERPALQRGCEILHNSGSIIVGMSLGNSYFSSENITRLFRFLHTLNLQVYIVVMDKPSEHNYLALGYSEDRVADKIKKKGAEIFRAIDSALKQVDSQGEHFHILNWDIIREHKDYQHARLILEQLYLSNELFRNDLRCAVDAYLTPKLKGQSMTEQRHISADQYLLEELAFLISSREILGAEECAYLYHKEWLIFERLVSGGYDQNLASGLGFVELKVQS